MLGSYLGSPWSSAGTTLAALRLPQHADALAPGDKIQIGVFRHDKGGLESDRHCCCLWRPAMECCTPHYFLHLSNLLHSGLHYFCWHAHSTVMPKLGHVWHWEQLDTSAAWNTRAGPQLQWLGASSRYLLFNDLRCRGGADGSSSGTLSAAAAASAAADRMLKDGRGRKSDRALRQQGPGAAGDAAVAASDAAIAPTPQVEVAAAPALEQLAAQGLGSTGSADGSSRRSALPGDTSQLTSSAALHPAALLGDACAVSSAGIH